jgi:hypothetical protein
MFVTQTAYDQMIKNTAVTFVRGKKGRKQRRHQKKVYQT